MAQAHVPLRLPDFGMPEVTSRASAWFKPLFARLRAGERLLEVVVAAVAIDLPAPVDGLLVRQCVEEDDPLRVGQLLAVIQMDEDDNAQHDQPA